MFTKDEAIQYLQDVLNIRIGQLPFAPCDERLQILNDIIYRQHEIPFQSISLCSLPPEKRRRPTVAEVKEAVLSKTGGLCYTLNVFLFYLLRALGYEAFLNKSKVLTGRVSDNHILVLVDNVVSNGDSYLAEVGCANPTFTALSLNFDKESPVYRELSLTYKLVKIGNVITQMHADHKADPQEFPTGKFEPFYEFEVNMKTSIGELDEIFDHLYENVPSMSFHRMLLAKTLTKRKLVSLVIRTLENRKLVIRFDNGN